ncbi:NAD(P)-dependent oxidoreductase [Chitinophaga pendula]|uniref:NAD-dependent epimerase/dehydratase family protein n=1 Tax=Chitinophaga TaxID=79328 RepID=UPI000BB06AEA|nr:MULTISPECIES: NAD(P)-dependent oxidoreductase [Chitinophaga]ASZ14787.1 epimerase [Chitinophaga sp. MD30]UCJ06936.1 NAD(P)-dependent oxidoreductase [Chitinophaga pendula]
MNGIAADDLSHVLQHTVGLWTPVRGKHILLTGGTGFFGKWMLETFVYINERLQLDAQITVLSRDPAAFLDSYPRYRTTAGVHFLQGDIQTIDFRDRTFHYIIHAATAADAALNSAQPLLMLNTIIDGMRRILDFASQQPLEGLLFTSSGAVYGKQPPTVTHVKETESFPANSNLSGSAIAYGEGKKIAELYCSLYHQQYGVPVKIARCFAFVGPYLPLDKHFAIGNFIGNVLRGEDIIIKGDGTPYRSYLYAADLAIWLWTILLKGKNNTPYNVGSDEDYTIGALAREVGALNTSIQVKILGTPVPDQPAERYVPNVDLAKSTLGLGVYTSLAESILKTQLFYKRTSA